MLGTWLRIAGVAVLALCLGVGCASQPLNPSVAIPSAPVAHPPTKPLRIAVMTEFGDGSKAVHLKRQFDISKEVCRGLGGAAGAVEFIPADMTAVVMLGEGDDYDGYLRLSCRQPEHQTKRSPAFILLWPATVSLLFSPIGLIGLSVRGMIHEYAYFDWEVCLYEDPQCTKASVPPRALERIKAVVTATGWGASDKAIELSYRNADTEVVAAAVDYARGLDWPAACGVLLATKEKRLGKGPASGPTGPAETRPPPGRIGNRWAVIVGLSKYEHGGRDGFGELPFAADDATGFRTTLLSLGWSSDHIRLLTNEQARKSEIVDKTVLSWLSKAGPDDLVVLFWAGHAFPDPTDAQKVYMVCYDTDQRIPATGYRMDDLHRALEECHARNVIVLADTCHAGKLITRGDERGLAVRPYVEKLREEQKVPRGWIFMVGADTDRKAVEHASWKHGAFSYCILEALQGRADGYAGAGSEDGVVTMGELRSYVSSVMPDITQKVLGSAVHPVIATNTGDTAIWDLALAPTK